MAGLGGGRPGFGGLTLVKSGGYGSSALFSSFRLVSFSSFLKVLLGALEKLNALNQPVTADEPNPPDEAAINPPEPGPRLSTRPPKRRKAEQTADLRGQVLKALPSLNPAALARAL